MLRGQDRKRQGAEDRRGFEPRFLGALRVSAFPTDSAPELGGQLQESRVEEAIQSNLEALGDDGG